MLEDQQTVDSFIRQILQKIDDPIVSVDLVMDQLDDWLLEGHFKRCSLFLEAVPIDKLSTAQLITILTVTYRACDKLPERAAFYDRVQIVLQRRDPGEALLLSGLKACQELDQGKTNGLPT